MPVILFSEGTRQVACMTHTINLLGPSNCQFELLVHKGQCQYTDYLSMSINHFISDNSFIDNRPLIQQCKTN